MNLRLMFLVVFFSAGSVAGAQELIINGDFEQENICIEYEQTCSPVAWRNTAHLPFGYQRQPIKGFNGEHYLPMVVEDVGVNNFRTYWQTRLKCALEKGVKYRITFYANALGASFIPENLGLYFSNNEVKQRRVWPIQVNPSVTISQRQVTSIKKSDWVKVELAYTATGDERFLALGNFRTDNEMQRHRRPRSQKVTYCVDGLSVQKAGQVPDAVHSANAADGRTGGDAGNAADCQPSDEVRAWVEVRLRHTPGMNDESLVRRPAPVELVEKDTTVTVAREVKRIDTLVLEDVLFKFDSGSLTLAAEQVLDTIVNKLRRFPYKSIRVEGHTDSLGTDTYNLDLSSRRARSVMQYFLLKGINTNVITSEGKGEQFPVTTNKTAQGRQRNRRVEILLEY